ncbi:MAG TPA: YciI family protein [Jiangellaceae bacterium]|nr:YciI family protein [Jiangellaceae bacterium]
MRYMLLIYGEEPTAQPSQEELDAEMAEWWAYDTAVKESGVYIGGDALQPSQTATTVRVKGEERLVTDGPFAETREVLGGFYVIDVPDLDTALDWAAKCPAATYGSMEVRPVMEFDTGP